MGAGSQLFARKTSILTRGIFNWTTSSTERQNPLSSTELQLSPKVYLIKTESQLENEHQLLFQW